MYNKIQSSKMMIPMNLLHHKSTQVGNKTFPRCKSEKLTLIFIRRRIPVFVRNSKERVPRGSNVVLRNIRFKALNRRFRFCFLIKILPSFNCVWKETVFVSICPR